uniref:Cytochrome c oxidase subunit 3 n=1 Tax=Romanomermis iyengari TaxID=416168 RepID=A1Z3B6_ROMIY|nr:cytochrome c oxidase subunit III [Romanomermis iyengari]ABL73797.1 cytochrome c oxidase subunit III [Romanomermis iyengari]
MFLQFNPKNSFWPVLLSIMMFYCFLSFINFMILKNFFNLCTSIISLMLIIFMWFKNLTTESILLGGMNLFMQMNLKTGMIFFIISEIMFFFCFFWSYFHFMFLYSPEFGNCWPPVNINSLNYLSVPLLNTMLLLSSGLSITLSHTLLMMNNKNFKVYLLLTIMLGLIFMSFQFFEYYILEFNWSMSSYSSIFFMGTGFHGFHVTLGSIMLLIIYILQNKMNLLSSSYEMVAWYWHFVDMIWIILFTEFYWWV